MIVISGLIDVNPVVVIYNEDHSFIFYNKTKVMCEFNKKFEITLIKIMIYDAAFCTF